MAVKNTIIPTTPTTIETQPQPIGTPTAIAGGCVRVMPAAISAIVPPIANGMPR